MYPAHRHTARLISPSGITQKWLQGFSMTCCLPNFPLSHACQLSPVTLVTVVDIAPSSLFPSAFAAMPPVNLTPRAVKTPPRNRVSTYVAVCVRNMVFSCMEPSAAGDSLQAPSGWSNSTQKLCHASATGHHHPPARHISAQRAQTSHFILPHPLFRVVAELKRLTGKHCVDGITAEISSSTAEMGLT